MSISKEVKTRLVGVLYGVRDRCYNPHARKYINYGARGVTVSDEWRRNTNSFIEDAVKLPGWNEEMFLAGKLQLDKDFINFDSKKYSKDNCSWVTNEQNIKIKPSYMYWHYGFNTLTNELVKFYNVTEFCKEYGISFGSVQTAISGANSSKTTRKGWASSWYIFTKDTMDSKAKTFKVVDNNSGKVYLSHNISELIRELNLPKNITYHITHGDRPSNAIEGYTITVEHYSLDDFRNIAYKKTTMILSNK